jgi:hypothetical protein
MELDRFVYDLGALLTILVIYVLAEIVALYLAEWAEHLAEKRHVKRVRSNLSS